MSNRRAFEGEAETPSPWRQCIEKTLPCLFRKPDNFGEGISFHQSLITTHRRFRPWEELNKEEKKDRIHYLWQQTRRYFWQQVIMFRITKSNEANIQVTVMDEDDLDTKRLEEVGEDGEDPYEKWYLINQNKNIPQIWEFIMNVFTIYSLVATPLM